MTKNLLQLLLFLSFGSIFGISDEKKIESFKNQLLEKTTSPEQRQNLERLLKNVFPQFANLPKELFDPEFFYGPSLRKKLFDLSYQTGAYFHDLLQLAAQQGSSTKSTNFFINPKYFLKEKNIKRLSEEDKKKRFEWTLDDEKEGYNHIFEFYLEQFLEKVVYPHDKTSDEYQSLRFFLANIAAIGFLAKDVTGWNTSGYMQILPRYYRYNTFEKYLKNLAEFPGKVPQEKEIISDYWKKGHEEHLQRIKKLSDDISETKKATEELFEQIKKNRNRGKSITALEQAHQLMINKIDELEYRLGRVLNHKI